MCVIFVRAERLAARRILMSSLAEVMRTSMDIADDSCSSSGRFSNETNSSSRDAAGDNRTRTTSRDPLSRTDSGATDDDGDGLVVAGGITQRRGAIKHQKVHLARGHRFVAKFFRKPLYIRQNPF
jgi:hypothetical protein